MKFWQYLLIASFVFVCMYNPKSGGLETFINGSGPIKPEKACCDKSPVGRSCQPRHYQEIQFAGQGMENSPACPTQNPKASQGAIIGR